MKCPFRKRIVYKNLLYGNGIPACEESIEEFEDCIGKKCTACRVASYSYMENDVFKSREELYCELVNNFLIDK